MNLKLYESLINGISYAIQKSLNEMARLAVLRTIDKKLWLSVASTCSRNKDTEVENIKPIGTNKENLLNRYVAALIIMRKPCPETEDDIDTLKTFKLIGKRYLQLGGTLLEILDLYNKNTGKSKSTSSTNTEKKPILKKEEYTDKHISTDNAISDEKDSGNSYGGMGLFDDDDIFGDREDDIYNSELTLNIVGLNIDADLTTVLIQQLGNKPRGWKFYKHTNDEYEKYVTYDVSPDYEWRSKKYVKDVKYLLSAKKWTCYNVDTPIMWQLSPFKIENETEDSIRDLIKKYLNDYNQKRGIIESTEETNKHLVDRMNYYKLFMNGRKKQINVMNNDYVKKLFLNDESIYRVYLSPDTGVILYVQREVQKINSDTYKYVLTFTGNVNYNNELRDKDYNKKLKEKDKLRTKRKSAFLKMMHKYCGLGPSFDYPVLFDLDDYPYMADILIKSNAEDMYRLLQRTFYRYGNNYQLYVKTDEHTEPDSVHELLQNKEYYKIQWMRFIYGENKGKYPTDRPEKDYYIMFKPTKLGRARIDFMLNNK